MKTNKGFTLVEIMIVVAIIALLASFAVPNLLRARVQANEATAKATLKAISTAMENYYATNTQYPLLSTALQGVNPPYLTVDYFSGIHNGYTYTHTPGLATYSVDAAPVSSNYGTRSFTVSTGGVLVEN